MTDESLYLGVDIGTGGVRAIAATATGQVSAFAEQPFASDSSVDVKHERGAVSLSGASGLMHKLVFLPNVRIEVNATADIAHDIGLIRAGLRLGTQCYVGGHHGGPLGADALDLFEQRGHAVDPRHAIIELPA